MLMMGLPDGPKSFKIGLVVLIQYRLWQTATQPATQPASHVAVAIRLYDSRRAQKPILREIKKKTIVHAGSQAVLFDH